MARFVQTISDKMVNLDHVATTRSTSAGRYGDCTDLFDREGVLLGTVAGDGEELLAPDRAIVPAPPGYTLIRSYYAEETDDVLLEEEAILAFSIGRGEAMPFVLDGMLGDEPWAVKRPDGKVDELWNRVFDGVQAFGENCLKLARAEVARKAKLKAAGGAKGS